MPRSLERVVKLKEAIKLGKIAKIKKRKSKSALISVGGQNPRPPHPKAKPEKVVPIFQQRPGESEQQFLHRVDRETHAFVNETTFEKKYGVQVKRDPETGHIQGLTKCSISELDKIEMLRAKHKNIRKKKKKKNADEIRLTKSQKRKEKLREKKEKKEQEDIDEFENFKDQVEFGEIAHEPPQLTTRPKVAESTSTSKVHMLVMLFTVFSCTDFNKIFLFLLQPGNKDLLLHSLLGKSEGPKMDSGKAASIDRSGKRKNLPVGERRQLERDQSDVIAAYKRMKAERSAGANG